MSLTSAGYPVYHDVYPRLFCHRTTRTLSQRSWPRWSVASAT